MTPDEVKVGLAVYFPIIKMADSKVVEIIYIFLRIIEIDENDRTRVKCRCGELNYEDYYPIIKLMLSLPPGSTNYAGRCNCDMDDRPI